jgi:hypothetical protein
MWKEAVPNIEYCTTIYLEGQRKSTVGGGEQTHRQNSLFLGWDLSMGSPEYKAECQPFNYDMKHSYHWFLYNTHKSKREIPWFHKTEFILMKYNLYITNSRKQNSEPDSPIFYCLEVLIHCAWYWLSCILLYFFYCSTVDLLWKYSNNAI